MDTELRKKLEAAAEKYLERIEMYDKGMRKNPYLFDGKQASGIYVAGAEQGYKEAITDVLKFLDEERHNLVVALENMTEECSPRHFAFYQRHYCLEKNYQPTIKHEQR